MVCRCGFFPRLPFFQNSKDWIDVSWNVCKISKNWFRLVCTWFNIKFVDCFVEMLRRCIVSDKFPMKNTHQRIMLISFIIQFTIYFAYIYIFVNPLKFVLSFILIIFFFVINIIWKKKPFDFSHIQIENIVNNYTLTGKFCFHLYSFFVIFFLWIDPALATIQNIIFGWFWYTIC